MYVMVYVKELSKKVPVKIPRRMQGKITKGKLIYLEADNSTDNPKYNWVNTPQRVYRSVIAVILY